MGVRIYKLFASATDLHDKWLTTVPVPFLPVP